MTDLTELVKLLTALVSLLTALAGVHRKRGKSEISLPFDSRPPAATG